MRNFYASVQQATPPIEDEHKKLAGMVNRMSHKIEVLQEDNRQLRAAVKMYQAALRRTQLTQSRLT